MTTVLLHEGSAAPKLEPPPRPQVRAVRGGNHGLNRVRHVMRTAVIVLILAVFGGLAISSLMSGATLMELNAQVDEVSAQLAEAQSEYDYLNTRMNDITSRASLQQVAEGELGLVKADPSQITREIDWFLHENQPAPKVFIACDRAAYVAKDNPELRITFDHNIRWRETELDLCAGSHGEPVIAPGQVLMEIKIPGAAPLWLAHMLSELALFPTGFSKYGSCYKTALLEKYFNGVISCV